MTCVRSHFAIVDLQIRQSCLESIVTRPVQLQEIWRLAAVALNASLIRALC